MYCAAASLRGDKGELAHGGRAPNGRQNGQTVSQPLKLQLSSSLRGPSSPCLSRCPHLVQSSTARCGPSSPSIRPTPPTSQGPTPRKNPPITMSEASSPQSKSRNPTEFNRARPLKNSLHKAGEGGASVPASLGLIFLWSSPCPESYSVALFALPLPPPSAPTPPRGHCLDHQS